MKIFIANFIFLITSFTGFSQHTTTISGYFKGVITEPIKETRQYELNNIKKEGYSYISKPNYKKNLSSAFWTKETNLKNYVRTTLINN